MAVCGVSSYFVLLEMEVLISFGEDFMAVKVKRNTCDTYATCVRITIVQHIRCIGNHTDNIL